MTDTTLGPTAAFLARTIADSGKTQREIARDAGFDRPNVISMMKQGVTRVPVARIPALARALGIDAKPFIEIAMEEYHPKMWRAIRGQAGTRLSPAEEEVLVLFRLATLKEEITLDEKAKALLEAAFEVLGDRAPRSKH
jgi:transcriptional regulator with XRE-family HTH domain